MSRAPDGQFHSSNEMPAASTSEDLAERFKELTRRHAAELRLADVASVGGGLTTLMRAGADLTGKVTYLLDPRGRIVVRAMPREGLEMPIPRLDRLLEAIGPRDVEQRGAVVVPASPMHGRARRHVLVPVAQGELDFAWLVIAEYPSMLRPFDCFVASRVAHHLAAEYATQRRIARVAWNAKANLARQLVRGSSYDEDLRASADYLGVDLDADRVVVFVAERDRPSAATVDAERLAELVSAELDVEVLGIRGTEGALLAVAAPRDISPVVHVGRVKRAVSRGLDEMGDDRAVAGLSAVTRAGQLRRAYRESREVALCISRFASPGTRVIAADDLGPARLFVANSDVSAVRTYVHDVLGVLLTDAPGCADLLRTLHCFFDTGRSIRGSSARLGIHENTVRLRLAKVHDLTGLDVAAEPSDQLSVQTALLVLRLQGHPAVPNFEILADNPGKATA